MELMALNVMVPREVVREFKALCAKKGVTLREGVGQLLEASVRAQSLGKKP
jgi:hypothetical protein